MIKFQDVPYMRLNMDRFEQKFRSQLEEFKHAKVLELLIMRYLVWTGSEMNFLRWRSFARLAIQWM